MPQSELDESEKGAVKGHSARGGWCAAGLGLKVTLTGLVVLGVVLRIAQWAHHRELWYDEAYLALDLASKSYAQLIGPLSWNMNYPIAFLLSTKLVTNCCGLSEYALRLLPLVAGLITIPIFALLSWRVAQCRDAADSSRGHVATVVIAALMFAVSKHHIYYSSELRHYALDVLAACVLYLISMPSDREPARLRRMALLGLAGAAVIWFSIASVFVIAAIATVDVLSSILARQWRRAALIAGCCVPWGLSFLAHLQWLRLNTLMRGVGPQIEAVCASMSVPLFPTSTADLRTYREAIEHVFSFPGGFTYVGLAAFAFLLGCIALWGNKRALLFKLTLPFVYTMAASSFHQYPFRNQYLLFLLPCLYLIVAEGIGAFFETNSARWRLAGLVLAIMLLTQPTVHSFKVLAHPRSGPGGASEIKPLLAHVQEHWRDGDVLYVCGDQRITFAYYGPRSGFQPMTPSRDPAPVIAKKQAFTLDPALASSAAAHETPARFWLLYQGHEKLDPGMDLASTAGKGPTEIEALRSESSSLFLYSVK